MHKKKIGVLNFQTFMIKISKWKDKPQVERKHWNVYNLPKTIQTIKMSASQPPRANEYSETNSGWRNQLCGASLCSCESDLGFPSPPWTYPSLAEDFSPQTRSPGLPGPRSQVPPSMTCLPYVAHVPLPFPFSSSSATINYPIPSGLPLPQLFYLLSYRI
jgi:hypothetical protein